MDKPVNDLGAAAVKLSRADRLRLIDIIMESLEPADAGSTTTWSEEIRSRIAAFERGEYVLEDADDVVAEARAALRR